MSTKCLYIVVTVFSGIALCFCFAGKSNAQTDAKSLGALSLVRSICLADKALCLTGGRITYEYRPTILSRGGNGKQQKPDGQRLGEIGSEISNITADALASRLARIRGLSISSASTLPVHLTQANASEVLTKMAEGNRTDARAVLQITDYGIQIGLEHGIWCQGRLWLGRSAEVQLITIVSYGFAKASIPLFGKMKPRSDSALIRQASVQMADRIVRELLKGVTAPFDHGGKYAILPAVLPSSVSKTVSPHGGEVDGNARTQKLAVQVSALPRQADILFQPELWPGWQRVTVRKTAEAMAIREIASRDMWDNAGRNDFAKWKEISQDLDVEYLFASRFVDIDFESQPSEIKDGAVTIAGEEKRITARVEGVVYGLRENRIIWRDITEGGTVQRMEYVRHRPRVRSDESAVLDAVRTSYAYLRYSFDEYCKQFDR